MCTVFHWDYPEALYKRGGWLNRDSADWFAEYTALLADKLSDRVEAVGDAERAPVFHRARAPRRRARAGRQAEVRRLPAGRAQRHARPRQVGAGAARARQGPEGDEDRLRAVGADRAARQRQARRRRGGARGDLRGQRPPRVEQRLVDRSGGARQVPGGRRRRIRQGHAEVQAVRPGRDEAADRLPRPQHLQGRHLQARRRRQARTASRSRPATRARASDWQPITPACMYWGPRFFYDRYKLPMSITENGLATRDQVFLDGKVHDPQRIDFMHRYLARAVARDQGRRAGRPATTPGRCSTTSSGPTATSSASAWSTSTTRTRSASRRIRSTGTGR